MDEDLVAVADGVVGVLVAEHGFAIHEDEDVRPELAVREENVLPQVRKNGERRIEGLAYRASRDPDPVRTHRDLEDGREAEGDAHCTIAAVTE